MAVGGWHPEGEGGSPPCSSTVEESALVSSSPLCRRHSERLGNPSLCIRHRLVWAVVRCGVGMILPVTSAQLMDVDCCVSTVTGNGRRQLVSKDGKEESHWPARLSMPDGHMANGPYQGPGPAAGSRPLQSRRWPAHCRPDLCPHGPTAPTARLASGDCHLRLFTGWERSSRRQARRRAPKASGRRSMLSCSPPQLRCSPRQ